MKTITLVAVALFLSACASSSDSGSRTSGTSVSFGDTSGAIECDPRRYDCHFEARNICGTAGYQIVDSGRSGMVSAGSTGSSRADDPFGAVRGGSSRSADPVTGTIKFKCKTPPAPTK